MNSLVIFTFAMLALGAYAVDFPPEMLQMIETCREQFKIDKDNKPIPEDKICFHKCVGEKMGLMDATGKLTPENVKAKLQAIKADPAFIAKLDECIKVQKDDPCKTAEAICHCMH